MKCVRGASLCDGWVSVWGYQAKVTVNEIHRNNTFIFYLSIFQYIQSTRQSTKDKKEKKKTIQPQSTNYKSWYILI